MTSREPLRILSLDGGGIRGISSLLILEDIMEKMRDANGIDCVPRPCEHFDLIGGTGTGGLRHLVCSVQLTNRPETDLLPSCSGDFL
ncbi:hypothetical protein VTN31DRAFT_2648 [Thermomyces dupontii]|uniref:uncharacterized protein n=1 Tax=Talaromyces thermophilus TaxID=28565 RepID=UPI003742BA93